VVPRFFRRPNLNVHSPVRNGILLRAGHTGPGLASCAARSIARQCDTCFIGEVLMYIFITLLLGLMVSGFGAGFAFACRMDPEENRD
jgi:hypothetical protein